MKSKILSIGLASAALVFGRQASATVTTQEWFHFGEGGAVAQTDSSGNGRNYLNSFFATLPPVPSPNAAGGVLGNSSYTSTTSMLFGSDGRVSELYDTGYQPPGTNYGVEIWFWPRNRGFVSDGTQGAFTPLFSLGGSIFGAGPGGGVAVVVVDNLDGTSSLQAAVVHQGDSAGAFSYFGPAILLDTNRWIHLALVNDNSNLIFYTNGVPCATNNNNANPLTDPAGAMFIGRDGGHVSLDGYLDEERVFTFAAGQFSTNDLLFHASPRTITQPADTTVWDGGAANFKANISRDPDNTYQWFQGSTLLPGETAANLYLPTVALADSGKLYKSAVTNSGNGLVTSNALLTVVPVQTGNVAAYRTAVNAEATLLAYFPADGSTGATITNTKDGTHNGTLELNARYDGQTNRAFGERALFLRGDGDAQIPSNPAYEFAGGNGTVEALIYLSPDTAVGNSTIFSVASTDGTGIRYALGASSDGNSLICTNDSGVQLTWAVPSNLLNRFAHVAFVFSGGTTVTAYLDGQSLGSKAQSGFGAATGVPAWIGSATTNAPSVWSGTIDELALYSSALSASTLAVHNSKFVFGTNTSGPTIIGQSGSKTVLAGGSPVLSVTLSGTPPFTYLWKSNGVALASETNSTLAFSHIATNATAAYTVVVTNPFGNTNNASSPINLTVVVPPVGYAAAVMTDNPSAFWRLADASGAPTLDSAGFNDGTYNASGVTYGAGGPPGDLGSGVTFDGTAGRAIVPYTPVLNPSGPFTLECWVKLNAYGFYVPISSMVRPARTAGYEFYLAGNFAGYEFHTAAGGNYNMLTGSGTAPDVGTWYHLAGVWDGTNILLYIDGTLIGTSSSPPFIANSSTPFYIGSRSTSSQYFNGTMSDVAFYNYALTQSQLQNHVGVALPLKLAITPSTNVVADTKPAGTPFDGFNSGGAWLASSSDGTTTRNGVIQFTATNATGQVTDFGYPDFGGTSGTIMLWMRSAGTTGGGNEGGILFDWRSSVGLALVHYDDNTLFIQAQNNFNHFHSVALVSDNKWHHVALTYDQTALGGVTLYVDGVLDSSSFNTSAWSWPVGQLMELGRDTRYDGGYWRNYDGMLDDFRIYNRILTAPEIGQASTGALVDTNALQLRLNFDNAPSGYTVTWPYGSLQTAPAVGGAYNTLTNVPSPFPVAPHGAQEYFRGLR